jgi:hypothetical protein
MKDFWNSRYQAKEYVYGMTPNEFLKRSLSNISSVQSALFPAEGEGRNAVYAASLGMDVVAFDYSEEAKKKADELALLHHVQLDYRIADLATVEFEMESFDLLVLIYAHFPPQFRQEWHRKLQEYLKPGGILLLEGFSKKHLEISKFNQNPSGPQNIEMLFSQQQLENDFSSIDIINMSEEVIKLNEGPFHQGQSAVLRLMGKKKM